MFDPLSLPLSEKLENPSKDLNFSSTNQTSVEVSIDEILNQTNENFSNFTDDTKVFKGFRDKTFRPSSEPKKSMNSQGRHYRYTQTAHKSIQRPSSVEKYKTNSSLEAKNPRKAGHKNEKPFKSQFLEAGKLNFQNKLKIKQFTPILSGKRVKVIRPEVKETRSEAKVVNLNQLIDKSLNGENFRKIEKNAESVPLIQLAQSAEPVRPTKSSKAFPSNPVLFSTSINQLGRSSEVFLSPLRNLQNFQTVSKVAENPYANFELSPNLTQILEDLKKNILLTESSDSDQSEEDFNDSDRLDKLGHLDHLDKLAHLDNLDKLDRLEKLYSSNFRPNGSKAKIREPSFGFGGGEFAYEDIPKGEEAIYYEPRLSESEKIVQTDDQTGLKNMLSIVTNNEFINSLKIIGKFASFIEIFHYFPIYMRGETIRTILHYAGASFDEKNYDFEDFSVHKSDFEFEELPCLEIDGLKLVQRASIARYLCQKFGYFFTDPYSDYLSSSLVDITEDYMKTTVQIIENENNFAGWVDWLKQEFSVILKSIEKRYINNGETGFFVGNSPSQADFEMFCLIHDQFLRDRVKNMMEPILKENAPKLIEFFEAFKNSSETLKKYLAERPNWMF